MSPTFCKKQFSKRPSGSRDIGKIPEYALFFVWSFCFLRAARGDQQGPSKWMQIWREYEKWSWVVMVWPLKLFLCSEMYDFQNNQKSTNQNQRNQNIHNSARNGRISNLIGATDSPLKTASEKVIKWMRMKEKNTGWISTSTSNWQPTLMLKNWWLEWQGSGEGI